MQHQLVVHCKRNWCNFRAIQSFTRSCCINCQWVKSNIDVAKNKCICTPFSKSTQDMTKHCSFTYHLILYSCCNNSKPILPSVYVALMQEQFCPDQKSRSASPGAQAQGCKRTWEKQKCARQESRRAPLDSGGGHKPKSPGAEVQGRNKAWETGPRYGGRVWKLERPSGWCEAPENIECQTG